LAAATTIAPIIFRHGCLGGVRACPLDRARKLRIPVEDPLDAPALTLLCSKILSPEYAAFERPPPFPVILANSMDLPKAFNEHRRSEQSNGGPREISDKLKPRLTGRRHRVGALRWLRAQLGLAGADSEYVDLQSWFCHSRFPAGHFPALKPRKSPRRGGLRRQYPPIGTPVDRNARYDDLRPGRPFSDTEEVHAGSTTPLRRSFELEMVTGSRSPWRHLPSFLGFPGWSRYQQEWHIDLYVRRTRNRVAPHLPSPPPNPRGPSSPPLMSILRNISEGKVRCRFKGP